MAADNYVWFHCARCGSLFQSGFEFDEERHCESCGRQASLGIPQVTGDFENDGAVARLAAFGKKGEQVEDDGHRSVRKKRRVNVMMRIVIAWTALMLGLVAMREYLNKTQNPDDGESVVEKMTSGTLADERIVVLNEALPDCHRALGGFLTAGTPELRNQFVVDSSEMAGKMATFYANNPFPVLNAEIIQRTEEKILQVGDEWMIFTRWKEVGKEGEAAEFDVVFQKDYDSWKLDWLHFSRYSEFPWLLFLAGDGPDEGEFRLFARRRLQGDDAEKYGARMTFEMIDPHWQSEHETDSTSQEFQVDRRSDAGLLLDAAFEAKMNGESPYGAGVLSASEPDDLVRIRVVVSREELGGVRRFRIEGIPACHWIDTDHPGFELEALKDDLFGGD